MGKSEYNNFILDYETIRDFLKEIFIYGCYKKPQMAEKMEISNRKLEKEFQRLQFYIEAEHRNEKNIHHSKVYGFRYDGYIDNNYLYDTYRIKTVEMNYFNRYILILQILKKHHKVYIKEFNKLSEGRLNCDIAHIRQMVNEMEDLGVVCRSNEDKNLIREAEDILDGLSEYELLCLRTAAEVYEKMIPCSVIGYS